MTDFRIRSRDDGAALTVDALGKDHCVVSIKAASLEASTRVWVDESFAFAEFWRGLAAEWRGWSGKKTWESLEDEFGLSAESNRTGHIVVTVTLASSHDPNWRLEVTLALEAGQLERIASDAADFQKSLPAAA